MTIEKGMPLHDAIFELDRRTRVLKNMLIITNIVLGVVIGWCLR